MKHLIALVGMPGAGKSEAAQYLKTKEIPFVRFGDLTEETVKEKGLPLNPENERAVREQLRNDLGMAAFAIKAKPKIEELLEKHKIVGLDGLYSWEEYKYLKELFPQLQLIHIAANANIRYERLGKRTVRPFTSEQARERDIAELENLNKGSPIALADYIIENNSGNLSVLHHKLDSLLNQIKPNLIRM